MPEDNPTLWVHHQESMKHEIRRVPPLEPGDAEILVRIDKFGLTSNNVTYAALGQQLHYFAFFPGAGPWSALPVWGLATVLRSRAAGVAEGSRVYGYFPAAHEATLAVTRATPAGFQVDRPSLPPQYGLYGQYFSLERDPFYLATKEDLMVVMRPLFLTGLLLADYLSVEKRLGAEAVLISSAASKTSYGLACALRAAAEAPVIGLASERSKSAALAMGTYDAVVTYDALASLAASKSLVYVDVSGSRPLRQRLADQLGPKLRAILSVGLTHFREGAYGSDRELGVPVETFFAPGWGARRQKEAGAQFFAQLRAGWLAQMESAERHFALVSRQGPEAVAQAFEALLQGSANPLEAWVLTL